MLGFIRGLFETNSFLKGFIRVIIIIQGDGVCEWEVSKK